MAAFTVIDHQELGVSEWAPSGNATVTSWTKSSIPDTYDHLMLKVSARTNSGYYGYVDVQLNADTTAANYSCTRFYAYPNMTSDRTTSNAYIFQTTGSSSTANTFGTATLWIPNYANTANFKSMLALSAGENASNQSSEWILMAGAGLWSATPAAVDQITLVPNADFLQYSTITLYGVTGA